MRIYKPWKYESTEIDWLAKQIEDVKKVRQHNILMNVQLEEKTIDWIEKQGHIINFNDCDGISFNFKVEVEYSFEDLLKCLDASSKIGITQITLMTREISEEYLLKLKEEGFKTYKMDCYVIRTEREKNYDKN